MSEQSLSKKLIRICKYYVIAVLAVVALRACTLTVIPPGSVGVRYNNALGLHEEDLDPGWHFEVIGMQRISLLPSKYLFLTYTGKNVLTIRTKDNNTVNVDVSVPYRIIPGKAWEVMDAGNHMQTADGSYRFERFANDTTISVLREQLANLQSADFYNTDRRLEVSQETLTLLNEKLATLDLQASVILIRAAYFRSDYEAQLAQIQLNEQSKLLDGAKRMVADQQQKLDNYTQQTNALVAAKAQDWARRIAELDRAYQVGLIDTAEDRTPGAARRQMKALKEDERAKTVERASKVFSIEASNVTDAHLLGIKNIQAETIEYGRRVRSQADGVSARLTALGDAKVAKVEGAFQTKLNALLGTPGGRAYVAYRAADNVKFDKNLTFQSSDGVPSVLRLRYFAQKCMGK
jgi:regulator of protease activity HflC (stomatin/prohibitin superfamily)